MKKPFQLHIIGGLANRLTSIVYALGYTRQLGIPLKIFWENNSHVSFQHFNEIFLPIKDVEFVSEDLKDECFHVDIGGLASLIDSWSPDCNKASDADLDMIWQEFIPVEPILKKVQELTNEPFIAIHARRMDGLRAEPEKFSTTDEDFYSFIDSFDDSKIFVAADNHFTQKNFIEKYGERVFYNELIPSQESPHSRWTSLTSSLIDLLVCVLATDFKGTNASTFSRLIHRWRQHGHPSLLKNE